MTSSGQIRCPKCRGGNVTITEELVAWGDLIFRDNAFVTAVYDGETEMQPTGRYSARCRGSTVAPDCRHRWQPRRATVESAFDIQARTRPTSPPAPRDYRAP